MPQPVEPDTGDQRKDIAKSMAVGFAVIAGFGLVLQLAGYDATTARFNAILELWWLSAVVAAGAGLYYVSN